MLSSSVNGTYLCIPVGIKASTICMSKNSTCAHKAVGSCIVCFLHAPWFRSQSSLTVMYLVVVACVSVSFKHSCSTGHLEGVFADLRLCLTAPESASAPRIWCAKPSSFEQVNSLSQAAASENGRDFVNKGNN